MSSTPRVTVCIRRFKITNHIRSDRPFNVLVVGPSASRKNACVRRLVEAAKPREGKLAVVTDYPDYYRERVFDARDELPYSALDSADCRVLEGIRDLTPDHFKYFESDPGCTTIITDDDYPKQLPRGGAAALDYVILFGGMKQLRRVWDDFGALIPKFRDFRQIYLACTNESDRYSDEFLVIKNDATTSDPNDVLFWGSLTHKHLEDITATIETTLLLNKVKTARHVQLPQPIPKRPVKNVVTIPDDVNTKDEEDEEDDRCCIM